MLASLWLGTLVGCAAPPSESHDDGPLGAAGSSPTPVVETGASEAMPTDAAPQSTPPANAPSVAPTSTSAAPSSPASTAQGFGGQPAGTSTSEPASAGASVGGQAGVAGAAAGGSAGEGNGGEPGAGGAAGAPVLVGGAGSGGESAGGNGGPESSADAPMHLDERPISFGTRLNPPAVVHAARELAASLADPSAPSWRAKGDQTRSYPFAEAGSDEPYRIVVPDSWDGSAELPLVMFLHGAGSDHDTYLNQNGGQLVTLAEEHGYLLVSPRGVSGAYGNFLRLTGPFGDEAGAAELMAAVTSDSDRTNELSERDVINVLEIVLHEYPIDRAAMFLAGHSMGSGGTWYIGGKYSEYWTGLAPMSGPFVQETGYPWDDLRDTPILVTEGTDTPSLEASLLLADWLETNGFASQYIEVNSDHGGMIPLVLPDVFDFFDAAR